ncbi:hypothetical protein GYH30_032269 [Glycine max]|nr:hypothetical protein GYH30_032269 [Glycine max]
MHAAKLFSNVTCEYSSQVSNKGGSECSPNVRET